MAETLASRFKHAWNAFVGNKDPTYKYREVGVGYSYRPDRTRFTRGNERSMITSIFNRIAMDVAAIDIKHCRLDENDRFLEEIDSGLNTCLNLEANIDQTGRAFKQDLVMSLLDEGCVAAVPIDTSINPDKSSGFDVLTMRVGKILSWYPEHVKIKVYNDRTGRKEDIVLSKRSVAIIESPLYSVINEPNSTLQRLIRKMILLDETDEKTASGKLDLIIQLPYVIKTDARRKQARERMQDIERQLAGSKYGVAYTDGTEKIVQLNRSLENNLLNQVDKLRENLYAQLGINEEILNGSAEESTMLNYYSRTTEPIISAIVDEFKRKFLSKTARTQGQSILFFRDPFKLVPVNSIAEIADKFTRNEIMTSNEIRQAIGLKPSSEPKADMLINSNLNHSPEEMDLSGEGYEEEQYEE